MVVIREINESEYSVLPKIEEMSDEIFLNAGIDLSHLSTTPYSYYESLDKEKTVIFVAEIHDEIVGFCYTKTVDNNGYLAQLSVIPQYTRKGIGTNLINSAISWSKQKGYKELLLTTFLEVEFNAPMYKRLGFEEFIPNEEYPQLCNIRDEEMNSKIEVVKRVAMRKYL